MVRSTFLACLALLPVAALAQKPARPRPRPVERLALNQPGTAPLPTEVSAMLPCSVFTGRVLDDNSRPLVGATVVVKGTQDYCSTNAEGYYSVNGPLRLTQQLRIAAAGYGEVEMPVAQCSQPTVVLQPLPGTRIKQGKRHYGKILEVGKEVE